MARHIITRWFDRGAPLFWTVTDLDTGEKIEVDETDETDDPSGFHHICPRCHASITDGADARRHANGDC